MEDVDEDEDQQRSSSDALMEAAAAATTSSAPVSVRSPELIETDEEADEFSSRPSGGRKNHNKTVNKNGKGGGGKSGKSSGGSGGSGGGGGSSSGGPTNPQVKPRCNCDQLRLVDCHLETKELWDKFNELGTEMIITKTGR